MITFDSRKEAKRFDELMILLKVGKIRELKIQPEFTLREAYTDPEGWHIRAIRYRADYSYEERVDGVEEDLWRSVVEDVKSYATRTREYEIKKKLMMERFQIAIREV